MRYYSPDNISRSKLNDNSICHYEINKDDAENQNFERLDEFMEKLQSYGALARQKVLFSFAGYDNDKRELTKIPETVSYAKTLIKKHPYFWYFAIQHNSEFFYLAFFINNKNMTIADFPYAKSFYIKQDKEDIQRFITTMAINLNIYGEEINDIDGSVECLRLWSNKILGSNL